MSGSPIVGDGDRFTLTADRVAKGGNALGLGPDGRVTFVDGAIPGETVEVVVTAGHRKRLEARVVDVVDASQHRVEPPCAMVAAGCGGCDWQHVAPEHQPVLRRMIVADALRRLGGIDEVDIRTGPVLPADGYRTTVRASVEGDRAAYRRRASNDTVVIEECVIAHPLVAEVLVDGRFPGSQEIVVRVGANTGERMVVVDGSTEGVKVPADVVVVDRADDHAHIHEVVGGIRFQVSAGSFFQCRPDGAVVLGNLVTDALSDTEGDLLDAYGGVGLLGVLAGTGRRVIGVESSASAFRDASYNYGPHGRAVNERFERWAAEPVGVAVADPARAGLKAAGCDVLAATGAGAIALVSCDPASLARDAALLQERGYHLDWVAVVDLFGQTSHVETVSRFVRR